MPDHAKRALIVTRLSRVTDATTSPERQLAICRELVAQRGFDEVGVAEDLDVSGAIDPFDRKRRPQLSGWLRERSDEFDVLIAYRVDRFTRSLRHLQELVYWCEDNRKTLVSATEQHFDTTTKFAGVVIALMGTVAQMELEAISERNASTARHNIKAGRYRGSQPPWGYRPEKIDGAWRLVQDAGQVQVIHEVAGRVVDGEPLQRIAHDLTRRGVPTPKDHTLKLQGKPTKGTAWSVTPLKRSLLSEAMLGRVTDANGKSIRGDDGSPIVRAEPILTREVFERLRVELDSRSKRGEPTERSSSLLLRVLHCGICGKPAYKFNGGSHSQFPRYRCKSMTQAVKCGNKTIRADQIDSLVERSIATLLGESERLERVWDSGSDHSAELEEINAELVEVTGFIGTPTFRTGTPQYDALMARIETLAARQEKLSTDEIKPAGWNWQPTGEKFGDWWGRQDVTAKNVWLRTMNVRAEFGRGGINLDLGDLSTLTQQLNASGPVAQWQEVFRTMGENGVAGIELSDDGVVLVSPDGQRSQAFDLASDVPITELLSRE
ncbi:recombinase family protein [Mycobacterium barrassiae]|uniref:recombinase family protein n=1 Tax=Mycobacterium barrassiae TaxID=319709 RepID=UPI002265EB32|nr:recombinase family protein [Mycobacterium barrassiae]MCV7299771.1 recombinase family protein [Mycobacterium barrassiae]